jgi:protein CpxP
MTKTLIISSLAGILGVGAVVLPAHSARPVLAERFAELGVTDAQKRQVRAILRQHQPTAGPMIKQLVEARRKLRDTIRAEVIDEKAIRAQAAKVASLEADLAVERAHIGHKIKPILTAEQVAQLKDMQVDVEERIDQFLSRVAKRIGED